MPYVPRGILERGGIASRRQGSACPVERLVQSILEEVWPFGGVQQVCTRNVTSLRRPFSCNIIVTNLEVQDKDFFDTPICSLRLICVFLEMNYGWLQECPRQKFGKSASEENMQ